MQPSDQQIKILSSIEQTKREFSLVAEEITRFSDNLNELYFQFSDELNPHFTEEEMEVIAEQSKEEGQLVLDTGVSHFVSGIDGGTSLVLASLIDAFSNAAAKKRTDDEESNSLPNKPGFTKQVPFSMMQKPSPLAPRMKTVKKERKNESAFKGLKVGETQRKRDIENRKRKIAFIMAKRRALESAMQKNAANKNAVNIIATQQQALLEKQQKMLKLEALGLIPKGMYSGPKPPTFYSYSEKED